MSLEVRQVSPASDPHIRLVTAAIDLKYALRHAGMRLHSKLLLVIGQLQLLWKGKQRLVSGREGSERERGSRVEMSGKVRKGKETRNYTLAIPFLVAAGTAVSDMWTA